MSSNSTPLVSVYLPTRNRALLVERAIRSVFAQTYQNIQLVVVDDESGRDTVMALERIRRENTSGKSMVVLRLDRAQGACAARNHALAACEGQFVTGLDDDDYFLPERVSRLVGAYDPQYHAFAFDGYSRETVLRTGDVRHTRVVLARPARLEDLLRRNIVGNQVLTLTERMREVGGFDVRLPAWQDHDLWIRLVRKYGGGRPAGGISYVHTVNRSKPSISGDREKISLAFDIFLEKHGEYAQKEAQLCLRMAKACYGIDALSYKDIPDMLRLGAPRHVLSTLYYYLANRPPHRRFR